MKSTYQLATNITATILMAALLGCSEQAPSLIGSDDQVDDEAQAAKTERIAQRIERNGRVLTVFDRQGKVTHKFGERAMYGQPVLSPDGTRVAVMKFDLETESADLWVLEVATNSSTRVTSNQSSQLLQSPVWSPDGSEVAYVALRDSYYGIYRQAANGEGEEELIYQHPGGWIYLTDWSMDGRFLGFYWWDLSGGTLYLAPLDDSGQVIEVVRSKSAIIAARLSHDSRFIAYRSDETGRNEIFVRSIDVTGATNTVIEQWQVSTEGGLGMVSWSRDGQELFYLGADRSVMVVPVNITHGFEPGLPTQLFKAPDAIPVSRFDRPMGIPDHWGNISRDGQRIVFAVPPMPKLQQITVLDREGKVLHKVAEPGLYHFPSLSPDGTRVAALRNDWQGDMNIWTFDVASGQGIPLTLDSSAAFYAPIWSPDGKYVAYVNSISTQWSFANIYRKGWDGTGTEEQLFRYTSGVWIDLTDWSTDGKFLIFNDSCEGVLHVVPLGGNHNALERTAIDWLRDEYSVAQARLSPDSRFMAYLSDETKVDVFEVYVRPFDATSPEASAGGVNPVQVSTAGAVGMIFWRHDGRELFYLTPKWEVMAVDVTTTPKFQAGVPKLLFTVPEQMERLPTYWKNVSRDGKRFVFALDVPESAHAR